MASWNKFIVAKWLLSFSSNYIYIYIYICKMVKKQSEAFHTFLGHFFFSSLKQNFIAYRSSKVSSRPDFIFEIHQLWLSGCILIARCLGRWWRGMWLMCLLAVHLLQCRSSLCLHLEEQYGHPLSTYFCIYHFELLHWCYDIRRESVNKPPMIN